MAGDSTDLGSLGNTISSFIFGGNTGLTYEALKRRQAIAQAVAEQGAKSPYPQNTGQGLTAMGRSLGARLQENRLLQAEAEYAAKNREAAQRYSASGGAGVNTGTPNQAVTPPMQAPAAAPTAPTPATAGQPNMFMGQPFKPASVVPQPDINPNAAPPPSQQDNDIPPLARPIRDRIAAALENKKAQAETGAATATPEVAQPNPTLPGATPPVQAQSFLLSQPGEEATPSPQQTSLGGGAVDPMAERRRAAIGGIESGGRGDPYSVVGTPTRGNYPLGRYQIMASNLPEWSQAALGRVVTPQEFLGNKEIQDAIFDHRFGGYANKYGDEGAARAWYAGEKGMNNPNATDIHGRLNVQQYGQDYLRRLGQRADAPLQTRMASLNTGVTTDAPQIMPRVPGVSDDENPPTPTDIQPAPAQVAQLGARGGLNSDMFSPVPMGGGMQRAAPNAPAAAPPQAAAPPRGPTDFVPTGAYPAATAQVYVEPKPVAPTPPPPIPMTQAERGAHAMKIADPGNPNTAMLADTIIKEEQDNRKYLQDRANAKYQAELTEYNTRLNAHQTSVGTQQERQTALDEKLAAEAQRKAYGNVPGVIDTKLTKSKEDTEVAIGGLESVMNARAAIDAGALFGVGSEAKLQGYRALAATNLPGSENARRIVAATERFPINLGGLIGQQTRMFGGSQLSPAEREFGEKMAGGNIALNEETARKGLEIAEKAARAKIADHQNLVKTILTGQPVAMQEVYKARDVVPPSQMTPAAGSVTEKVLRMSPTDREALDWARVNSSDPRSVAIKKRLGVP